MKKNKIFRQKLVRGLLGSAILFALLQTLLSLGILNAYWEGILIVICINIILTVSLNLVSGFLGELSLGHAGFMAVGAYGAAWFSRTMHLVGAVEFPLALLFGGLLGMLLGYLVSIPTLRLRGDYLAIITLAFAEIVRNILTNWKYLGGAAGYSGFPKYTTFAWVYFTALLIILLTESLIHSRQGRSILSVREDEIAAEASGIDTDRYKKLAFVLSAFFCGIGGGLYAHYLAFLQPSVFDLDKSIEILVMCVLGGMGNLRGSVIAAVILTILPEALRSVADYRMLLYSIVLIVMMLVKNSDRLQAFLLAHTHRKEDTEHAG